RYVWRTLTRAPGFFVVTVATLGLGIGATTAIFSVVEGVLLRPLPYPRSERIVQIWQVNQKGNNFQFSDLNFRDVGADSRSLATGARRYTNSVRHTPQDRRPGAARHRRDAGIGRLPGGRRPVGAARAREPLDLPHRA